MLKRTLPSLLPFCLFLCFALGIVLGRTNHSFPIFFTLCLGSLAGACLMFKKNKLWLSDIAILFLFLGLGGLWVRPALRARLALDDYVKKEAVYTLRVVSLPQEKSTRNTFYAYLKPFNKKLKAFDYTRQLEYLHFYQVKGKISRRNYQGRDFYTLWVKQDAVLKQLPLPFWDKYALLTTRHLLALFKNNLKPQGYRFMASVFLGRRELLGQEKQILTRAGVAHLLAISGLHMGLTALILFFILGLVGVKFRPRLAASLLFLCLYTFLTGASTSSLRSVLMYFSFAFGFFLRRRVNLFNSWALAGFILLVFDPLALFAVGFQLSFVSVFALILGNKLFPLRPGRFLALNYLRQLFLASCWVTLFITPLVSYYFGRIYLAAVVYNVILIPFFTLILIVNFLLIIFSPLAFLVQSLGSLLSVLVGLFISLARYLGGLKFSFLSYQLPLGGVCLYYCALALGLGARALARARRRAAV